MINILNSHFTELNFHKRTLAYIRTATHSEVLFHVVYQEKDLTVLCIVFITQQSNNIMEQKQP